MATGESEMQADAGEPPQSKHGDSHRPLSAEEADVATGESEMQAAPGEAAAAVEETLPPWRHGREARRPRRGGDAAAVEVKVDDEDEVTLTPKVDVVTEEVAHAAAEYSQVDSLKETLVAMGSGYAQSIVDATDKAH